MLNVVVAPTDDAGPRQVRALPQAGQLRRGDGPLQRLDRHRHGPLRPRRAAQTVKTKASQSMVDMFSKMDPDKEWTPRQIAEFIGIGGTGPTIVGSPTTVADELPRWMNETDIDGINLVHPVKSRTSPTSSNSSSPNCNAGAPCGPDHDGSTLREKLYGPGAIRLRDDHPGHRIAHRHRRDHPLNRPTQPFGPVSPRGRQRRKRRYKETTRCRRTNFETSRRPCAPHG